MNRREFLGGLAFLGCQGLALNAGAALSSRGMMLAQDSPAASAAKKGKFDDDTVVFISDLHIKPGGWQPEHLVQTINDILKMNPLPRNIIALGDLAYLTGKPEEYALLREIIKPIERAGITLTLGMGNHDRRENFASAFPEYAAKSQLKGYMTYVVDTPRAAFVIMDSLQEGEDHDKWITAGKIEDDQRQWLTEKLKEFTKPLFVCSHHPINETAVKDILVNTTTCGYIHGHDHVWRPGWAKRNYSSTRIVPTLCIPSTGFWGDIGYIVLSLKEKYAVAELKQYDFYFPKPIENIADRPLEWQFMVEDHQNQKYHFAYKYPEK